MKISREKRENNFSYQILYGEVFQSTLRAKMDCEGFKCRRISPSMLVKNLVVLRHELHPHLPMEKFNDSYNYFDIKHPAHRCCVSIVS